MEKENVNGDFHMGYEDQSMLCCDFDKLKKGTTGSDMDTSWQQN